MVTWDANPTSLRSGDWRGNLTNDGNREYTYDQANRLIAVSDQQSAVSFAYNGDPLHCVLQSIPEQSEGTRAGGARVMQTANGDATTYTLDLAAPLVTVLAEYGIRNTQYVYGQGDSPLASYDGAGWTYLSGRDGLNSVRQETDAAGNVIATRNFDPYGAPMGGDGGSPYRYASSNPVNRVDPTGYVDWSKCEITGEFGTCRVKSGEWLWKIARDLYNSGVGERKGEQEVKQIVANILGFNTHLRANPDLVVNGTKFTIPLDWILIAQGISPSPELSPITWWGVSGYLEGQMRSLTGLGCVMWINGDEIVYDFVSRPPQRAHFTFTGLLQNKDDMAFSGFSWKTLGEVTRSDYAGLVFGFTGDDIREYAGPTASGSLGLTLGAPVPELLVGLNVGGGIGGFRALSGPTWGFIVYGSAGAGINSPGLGSSWSIIATNYSYQVPTDLYGNSSAPDLGKLQEDIRNGNNSPSLLGLARWPVANWLAPYIVEQNYALYP